MGSKESFDDINSRHNKRLPPRCNIVLDQRKLFYDLNSAIVCVPADYFVCFATFPSRHLMPQSCNQSRSYFPCQPKFACLCTTTCQHNNKNIENLNDLAKNSNP